MTPISGLVLVTAPLVEPVSIAEAKAHAREQLDAEDDLFAGWIRAARELVEQETFRALINQTWRLSLDHFYRGDGRLWGDQGANGQIDPAGRDWGANRAWWHASAIELPLGRLQAVSLIQYVDLGGATQTLNSSLYQVDTQNIPGRVLPAYGQIWPTVREQANAAQVTYVVGYGASALAVPEVLKLAIRVQVAEWHENREAPGVLSEGVKRMIAPYSLGEYR